MNTPDIELPAEPVKRKRRYAQGTALGSPMTDPELLGMAAKERIRWLSRRLEETQGIQDMLDDARLEIQQLREALKVTYEPHQSVSERTLIEAKFGSAMIDLVMSHIDRMNDICEQDTAEQIIESFITKFQPVFDEYLREKWPDREELFRKNREQKEFE